MKAVAGLLLAFAWIKATAADTPRPFTPNTIGEKPYGVLLLGEGGDRDWKSTVEAVRKRAGKRYPLEFAGGQADGREMQRSLDALLARRVKTIVIVPLFVSSYGEVMDQNRYLLGIRQAPSPELAGPHGRGAPPPRLHSRAPLVLAKALDDHPLFVDLLVARAQALSRHPEKEAVVLVGEAPVSTETAKQWTAAASDLAEKVRRKGGFKAGRAFALREDAAQTERERSESELKALLKELRRDVQVIVVPLSLTGSRLRLTRALDGLFAKYDGRAILPDDRVVKWIDETAAAAAKLPDMRLFKDAAKAGLMPAGLAHPAMTPPPALPRKGEKNQ